MMWVEFIHARDDHKPESNIEPTYFYGIGAPESWLHNFTD